MANTDTLPDDFIALEMDDSPAIAPKAAGVLQPPTKPLTAVEAPKAPTYAPGDSIIAEMQACATPDELARYVASINGTRALTTLPRAAFDRVLAFGKARKAALLAVPATPILTAMIEAGIAREAPITAPEAPIASVLASVAAETRRPAMRAPTRVTESNENTRARIRTGEFIAGAIATGGAILVSWGKLKGRARIGATVDRASVVSALAAIGREVDAPPAKSAAAHFGRACGVLNSNGLVARSVTRKESAARGEEWPSDVESRWVVGHLDGSTTNESLGDKLLIADLTDRGNLRFSGRRVTALAPRVQAEFDACVAGDTYTSTDLVAWFSSVLYTRHHGAECGAHVYIPGGQVATVRTLIDACKGFMGRRIQAISVVTESELVEGISEGLADEVASLVTYFDRETVRARDDKRAAIGSRMAATILRDLITVGERVSGYEAMLGAGAVASVKASIASLDSKLRALVDDSSERYAAMELN